MNVFDKTLELLETRGWNKGTAQGTGMSMCLGYALDVALASMGHPTSNGRLTGTPAHRHVEAIIRTITRTPSCISASIPNWNDMAWRTFADVKAVLVRASEEHEAGKPIEPTEPTSFYEDIARMEAIARMQAIVEQTVRDMATSLAVRVSVEPQELISA